MNHSTPGLSAIVAGFGGGAVGRFPVVVFGRAVGRAADGASPGCCAGSGGVFMGRGRADSLTAGGAGHRLQAGWRFPVMDMGGCGLGLDRAASFAFAGGVGVSQGCIADDTAGGTVFRHKTGGGRPTVGVDGFFRDIRIVGLCAVGGVCGTAEIAVAQVKTVSCWEASGFTAKGAGDGLGTGCLDPVMDMGAGLRFLNLGTAEQTQNGR